MQIDPMAEVAVMVRDLEEVHSTLTLVKDVLIADDLARSGRLMVDAAYTPLTKDVMARAERVEGLLKDFYANQYLAGQDVVEEIDLQAAEQAHTEALSANPLSSGKPRKAPKLLLTADEPT